MLTTSQHDRIAGKCATAFTRAIESLPRLLEDSDPDKAAAIVADLIKAYLGCPTQEPDPGAALAAVIRQAREEVEQSQPASADDTKAASDQIAQEFSYPRDYTPPAPSAPEESEPAAISEQPARYESGIHSSPSHTFDD